MNATPPTDRGSTQIHIEAECVIDGFGGKFVERPMRISTVNSDLGHTFVAVQDAACRNIFLEKLRHQSRTALPLLGLYPTASPFDPQQVMSKQLLDNVGRHGGGTPDGGCVTSINAGPANGLGAYTGPMNALAGVFLDDTVPSGQAPATASSPQPSTTPP